MRDADFISGNHILQHSLRNMVSLFCMRDIMPASPYTLPEIPFRRHPGFHPRLQKAILEQNIWQPCKVCDKYTLQYFPYGLHINPVSTSQYYFDPKEFRKKCVSILFTLVQMCE